MAGDPISDKLRRHYAARFAAHGASSEGVDWGPDQRKLELRYQKMLAVMDPYQNGAPPSLLDVGCGYGGLSLYAQAQGLVLDYTGIDVASEMIAWARANGVPGTFEDTDLLEMDASSSFDFVVCNGILTQKLDTSMRDMDDFADRLIRRMFGLCRRGVAFNTMSTHVNYFADNLYYRSPTDLLAWCMAELTPHVQLDHSYPLYEYTVYLYREPA